MGASWDEFLVRYVDDVTVAYRLSDEGSEELYAELADVAERIVDKHYKPNEGENDER